MKKIFINPGHDIALDPGAVNRDTGLREADVALAIGKQLAGYLTAIGYECRIVQDDDLNYVCRDAGFWGADLFISVHCNSFGDTSANGIETLYFPNSVAGEHLATCIQNQLVDSMQLTDRGIKKRPDLGVLRLTSMPAVLVETAFISNAIEERILSSDSGKNEIAKAIARGVTDYYAS